jgi:hypothetical protein
MLGLCLRMVNWAFLREPPKKRESQTTSNIYVRALDLATTLRGVGWTVMPSILCIVTFV